MCCAWRSKESKGCLCNLDFVTNAYLFIGGLVLVKYFHIMIWSNKRRRQVLLHLLYATLLKAHVCWYTNRCNFSTIRIPTLLNVSVCTITTCVDCMWVSVCVLVKIFSSEDGGGVLVPSPFQLKNLLRRQHCNDGGSSGTLSTKNSKWNNVKIFSLSKILLFLPIHLICLLGFWIFQSKLLHTFLVLKWFQYKWA